jgi:hypothetical protein
MFDELPTAGSVIVEDRNKRTVEALQQELEAVTKELQALRLQEVERQQHAFEGVE